VVESKLHEPAEEDRTISPDLLGNDSGQWVHATLL
jgi:hypothetical protein